MTSVTNGLTNYWPIKNDLRDYIGTSDMSPAGNFVSGGSVGFGTDRFGNPTGAIFLNNGAYVVPNGVYFNGSFSVLAWVKIVTITSGSRLIDFSTRAGADNVIASLVTSGALHPSMTVVDSSGNTANAQTNFTFNLQQWYHMAAVMKGSEMFVYVNGIQQGYTNSSVLPSNRVRTYCFIGRSAWYQHGDDDADAYFDEIKIYNRALSDAEVANDMNVNS